MSDAKKTARILVVDDEDRNRRLLGAMLEAEGYSTLEAADGTRALELARQSLPDIILLDIMMPGIDGYEVARTLKADAATQAIPIVMVTALDDRESRLRGLEAGAEEFVTKPVDRNELRVRVRNLLRLKEFSDFLANHNRILEEQVRERTAKVVRLNRVYSVLSGINTTIVRVHERDELFAEACRIAVEHGQFRMAWIGLVDPEGGVEPVAKAGFEEGYLDRLRLSARSNSAEHGKLVQQVVLEKAAVVCNDIETDPRFGPWRDEALKCGYRSVALFPLLIEQRPVGLFVLYAPEPGFFDEQEMKLLNELAGDISFALDHIAKEEKLNYLAYYDVLTGLPNRILFCDRLSHAIQNARHSDGRVAVLFGDIKRFRHINETLGRHAGDRMLREIAQRFRQFSPEPDNVARIFADCFAGIMSSFKDASEVAHLVEKSIADLLGRPFSVDGKELLISLTAGIAIYPTDGEDADTLLKNAEAALEKAKASGEGYLFYEPRMNATVAATLMLENKLRQALEKGQFELHYQPKVDLRTRRITGLEALIRWNDPETGLVPPIQFIPLLEETGLIVHVGLWAIWQALADYREWHGRALQPPRIAVNVSPIQLRQKDFVDIVHNAIQDSGLAPHGLDLEITESLIMDDIEGNIEKLKKLRDMGIKIAIDDFGTGYSSLGYLARLPVDALKIDRSFIITMTRDSDSMAIVSTIVTLAHSLEKKVIAEGVETDEQSRILTLLKCDEMQGYLFSKPLPASQLIPMLEKASRPTGLANYAMLNNHK